MKCGMNELSVRHVWWTDILKSFKDLRLVIEEVLIIKPTRCTNF